MAMYAAIAELDSSGLRQARNPRRRQRIGRVAGAAIGRVEAALADVLADAIAWLSIIAKGGLPVFQKNDAQPGSPGRCFVGLPTQASFAAVPLRRTGCAQVPDGAAAFASAVAVLERAK